ncbi:MAG: hypothetical protein DRP50_06320 [Thermotoga sp.]|nr:MAG: hypothetical protein DRP50_06320 [Thermotoga sp.]
MLLSVIVLLVIIVSVVAMHEFGHFVFARIFNVYVIRFSIGFGPALFRYRKKETEYVIAPIPLGGYVKLAGESREALEEEEQEIPENRFLYSKPAWQRFFIFLGGPLANILFAYLVFAVLTLSLGTPRVGIDGVLPSKPAYLAGIQREDIIESIKDRQIFDAYDISEIVDRHSNEDLHITILRGGKRIGVNLHPYFQPPYVEVILDKGTSPPPTDSRITSINGVNCFSLKDVHSSIVKFKNEKIEFTWKQNGITKVTKGIIRDVAYSPKRAMIGIMIRLAENKIEKVDRDSVFYRAGVRKGAKILKVNGNDINSWSDFIDVITSLKKQQSITSKGMAFRISDDMSIKNVKSISSITFPIRFTFKNKNGNVITVDIKSLNSLTSLYFTNGTEYVRYDPITEIIYAISRTNKFTVKMVEAIGTLLKGKNLNQFVGPVGLTSLINQGMKSGFNTFVSLIALITLNLGIINLIPLPALDGGRIAFVLLEMISRKRLNPEIENYIHLIGFIFLILLFIFVTYGDILRLGGGG